MQIIPHERNTGFIDPLLLKPYKPFGWWERLKMGGIGSPKVFYREGIDYFEEKTANRTDLPLINFELLETAMLIRLSIHNDCYTVVVLKQDLGDIRLKKENQTHFLEINWVQNQKKKMALFEVNKGSLNGIKQYFDKPYFN